MKRLLFACFAALMVAAFTVPAMAADWNFYGSARMATFYDNRNDDWTGTAFSDNDLNWGLQSNSRIGARVKAGDVGGRFEYGTGVNLRMLYGTWNFGPAQLLVGQTYTPLIAQTISNQVEGDDNDLALYGDPYEGRIPMIQVSVAGFEIAAITPSTDVGNVVGFAETDTTLPKLEVSYDLKLGPASISMIAGYNSFDVVDANDNSDDITSYIYSIEASTTFGPAYLKGNYWAGKNVGNFGCLTATDSSADLDANGDISDTDSFGYQAVIGFKVNDMLTLESGYGFVSSEDDIAGHDKDEARSYYAQAVITLAKGVMLVPEVGMYDNMEDDTGIDEGKRSYYGAKWQINF